MKGESEDSVSDVNYNRLKGKNLPLIHIARCIHMHIGLWLLVVSDEGVEEEEEDGEDSSRGCSLESLESLFGYDNYKWKNHFYKMKGDVGMSGHEKERKQEDAYTKIQTHS